MKFIDVKLPVSKVFAKLYRAEKGTMVYQQNMRRLKIAVFLILLVLLLVVFAVLFGNEILNSQWTLEELGQSYIVETDLLQTGSVIEQSFFSSEPFDGVFLRFVTYAQKPAGTAEIRVREAATNQTVATSVLDLSTVFDIAPTLVLFDVPVQVERSGARFILEITVSEMPRDTVLSLATSNEDVYRRGSLSEDGRRTGRDLGFGLIHRRIVLFDRAVWVLAGLLVLGAAIAIVLTLKNCAPEKVYAAVALTLGIVLLFVQTAMYGFDMQFQFNSSYRLSNVLLGKSDWNAQDSYLLRACDDISELPLYHADDLLPMYNLTCEELFTRPDAEQCVPIESLTSEVGSGVPLYVYLPQAIGFSVARLLGLSRMALLFLGRLCNYLVMVGLFFAAIRIVPFAKPLFFVWGLLPAVCSQGITLSRDAILLGLCAFYIAKCLQLSYTTKKISVVQIGMMVVPIALVAPCKFIYLPLSLLGLLVLMRRRRKRRIVAVVLQFAAAAGMFVLFNLPRSVEMLQDTTSNAIGGLTSYGLLYLLTHPLYLFPRIIYTITGSLGEFIFNAVATYNIKLGLTEGIAAIYLLLMLLSVLRSSHNIMPQLKMSDRILFGFVFAAVFGAALLAAMQWTPMNSWMAQGMQGRYFTPVLVLPFLAVAGGRFVVARRRVFPVVSIGCVLTSVLYLCNMYLWTLQ